MSMTTLYVLLAAEGHKAPPLVDIDGTIFVQLGIFLFLLVVLTRLVFRPYLALRSERSKSIDGAKEEAQRLAGEATEKSATYEEKISQTRKEAAGTRAEIRQQGEAHASGRIAEAHHAAEEKIEAARQDIQKSTQAAQLALRTRADQIARVVATKILGREV